MNAKKANETGNLNDLKKVLSWGVLFVLSVLGTCWVLSRMRLGLDGYEPPLTFWATMQFDGMVLGGLTLPFLDFVLLYGAYGWLKKKLEA